MHSELCFASYNRHCLTYLGKNPMKIACFYDFLCKNHFVPISYTQNDENDKGSKAQIANCIYIWKDS